MAKYDVTDLIRFLATSQQPPEEQAPTIDLSPIVVELRRIGGLIVDNAPPRLMPG